MTHPRSGGFHHVQKGLLHRPIIHPGKPKGEVGVGDGGKDGHRRGLRRRGRRRRIGHDRGGGFGIWRSLSRGRCARRHPRRNRRPSHPLQRARLLFGQMRIPIGPAARQLGRQPFGRLARHRPGNHHGDKILTLAAQMDLIGKHRVQAVDPRHRPRRDFVFQKRQRLPGGNDLHSLPSRAQPQGQVLRHLFAPRQALARPGGPAFEQIDPHLGVGRARQIGKARDIARRVRPFHMLRHRDRLGQDQRIGRAQRQTRPRVHPFGIGRVFPVKPQRRAIDDLRLNHRRALHLAQGLFGQHRQIAPKEAVPHHQHICQNRKHRHGLPFQHSTRRITRHHLPNHLLQRLCSIGWRRRGRRAIGTGQLGGQSQR